jgi:hypothetical protein
MRTHPMHHLALDLSLGKVLCLAVVGVLALLGACGSSSSESVANGDDPVDALRSSVQSARYTAGYWKEQGRAATGGANGPARARWDSALAYCGGAQPRPGLEADGAKPNCNVMRWAYIELQNEASARAHAARVDSAEARRRAMTPRQRDSAVRAKMF